MRATDVDAIDQLDRFKHPIQIVLTKMGKHIEHFSKLNFENFRQNKTQGLVYKVNDQGQYGVREV